MKVSIVTVCFNNQDTIKDTLDSIAIQDYQNIEHIIIDGLSSDGTIETIKSHPGSVATLVSEKDKGIYDAMNKGISYATGDIVVFLNADDFFAEKSVISSVVSLFEKTDADAVYGNLLYVHPINTNKIFRSWIAGPYKPGAFYTGWMPPHPTFFVKRSVFNCLGTFDLRLNLAADYELMLRFIHKNKIKLAYLDKVLVHMRTGGISNASFKNRLIGNKEDIKAWQLNGLKGPRLLRILKPLRKLNQFVTRKSN